MSRDVFGGLLLVAAVLLIAMATVAFAVQMGRRHAEILRAEAIRDEQSDPIRRLERIEKLLEVMSPRTDARSAP